MEDDESETYLDRLPHKFSEEVRELLTYNEDTAGGIMTPVVITVNDEMTVGGVARILCTLLKLIDRNKYENL